MKSVFPKAAFPIWQKLCPQKLSIQIENNWTHLDNCKKHIGNKHCPH